MSPEGQGRAEGTWHGSSLLEGSGEGWLRQKLMADLRQGVCSLRSWGKMAQGKGKAKAPRSPGYWEATEEPGG